MKILRESIPFIAIPMIVAIVSLILGLWSLVGLSVFVALFMAFFFRDPRREPPIDPNVVVAPADGKVTRVVALDENSDDSPTLVSIFLSPLDVHINRAPIPGTIRDVVYSPGKFLMATNKNASIVNEQNILTIQNDRITVVCKQIAGILHEEQEPQRACERLIAEANRLGGKDNITVIVAHINEAPVV